MHTEERKSLDLQGGPDKTFPIPRQTHPIPLVKIATIVSVLHRQITFTLLFSLFSYSLPYIHCYRCLYFLHILYVVKSYIQIGIVGLLLFAFVFYFAINVMY